MNERAASQNPSTEDPCRDDAPRSTQLPQRSEPKLKFDPIDEARRLWASHGWADASLGMAVVTSVFRVQQIFSSRISEALQPFDLTFARYEVLALLAFTRTGMLPIGKVGERLQVHATSATNAVDRLERQGFVERRPHPTDRRAILVAITNEGRAVLAAATPHLNEVFVDLDLNENESRSLFEVLRLVRRANGDFPVSCVPH